MVAVLTIDIGNTSLAWGVWEESCLTSRGSFPHAHWVDGGDSQQFPEEWANVERVGVASVELQVSDRLLEAWPATLPPIAFFSSYRDVPIVLAESITDPAGVGVDRLLNVLAWGATHPGDAAVIVDFGTAITIDLADREGRFSGGLILPGAHMMARALGAGTFLLPEVTVEPSTTVIGTDTRSAIERGVGGLLTGGIEQQVLSLLTAFDADARVVATGGGAATWTPGIPSIDRIIPDLTLAGVRTALALRGAS